MGNLYYFILLQCLLAPSVIGFNFFGFHGFHSNPDIFCIAEHCSSQSAACVEDRDCRANMECSAKCGFSNFNCLYECINTYENQVYDKFMKCMVEDYHCLKLVSPDPSFRCKPPQAQVKNFSLSALNGKWYIVYGLNPEYDCFNCQISTYAPTPNSKNLTLTEKYDVTMLNGSTRHRVTVQQVQQRDIFNGGLLDFTNVMMGLMMYEKWQIIDFAESGNYAVIYYCGHMTSDWYYEGGLVYSRTPTISSEDLVSIQTAISTKLGHKLDQYCHLRTEDCVS
ncbi:hypothetical protein ACF0H5_013429 [Mactra antiquata]